MLITKKKVESEIEERMNGSFSADNVSKLADLCTVWKCLFCEDDNGAEAVSATIETMPTSRTTANSEEKSEFLKCAEKIDSAEAWRVMDDLMDTLRVSNKRVYDRIMREMRDIG